jgi:Plant PDR ABC transporter associated
MWALCSLLLMYNANPMSQSVTLLMVLQRFAAHLLNFGVYCLQYDAWIWCGVGAMILSALVLNAGVILALTYQSGSPVHDHS